MNTRAMADLQLAKSSIAVVRIHEDTHMDRHSKSSVTPSAGGSIYLAHLEFPLVREYRMRRTL